jgi:chemotaxis protein histidine kinase CheA
MSESVHLLVVRAGGLAWALPMSTVEQTFDLREHRVHRVGFVDVVSFRGQTIELVDVADRLGLEHEPPTAAVVVWATGRRRAFAVEKLVGQIQVQRLDVPALATGDYASGLVLYEEEVVPILEPGAITGARSTSPTRRRCSPCSPRRSTGSAAR